MFNKNKLVATITCFVTSLVAIFVFICPVNYYETKTMSHPVVSMSDCNETIAHTIPHNMNDVSKKCVDFHVASAQYYLAIQAKTLSIFSLLVLIAILAFTISAKSSPSHMISSTLSRFRHRYLFYLNKFKLLQTKKFREWLTLLNYREIVSMA